MNVHLSEEEQVEALKNWWKENGRSAVAGVVIGLGAVFGWQQWGQYQQSQAELVSFKFEKLDHSVNTGNHGLAQSQAKALMSEHQESSYAVFASLELAKVNLQQGDSAAAQAQLKWVIDHSADASLKQLARIRLARLLLDQDKPVEAMAVVRQGAKDSFAGDFAELRGDISLALVEGDPVEARQAYAEALELDVSNAAVVQMKLDDLAVN